MLSLKAGEKGVQFQVANNIDGHLKYKGDPVRVRQIILNLCSNAVKFTEEGMVRIDIAKGTRENGIENIKVIVTDTGIGISNDKIVQIFDKFVQADSSINRKYGGTGLGLAITKTLTEAMGGTIDVKSKMGEGSVFTVTLPLAIVA